MDNWYNLEASDVVRRLNTGENGLNSDEASARLEKYGPNELSAAAAKNPLSILLDQFKDFMIGVLLAAAIISGLIGDVKDTIAIVVIVFLNAAIGFVQEYRAEKAMAALKEMAALKATVMRDGVERILPSNFLVAGDVVLLNTGKIVPADIRLVETSNFTISESILTGESVPVEKTVKSLSGDHVLGERKNLAFSGTTVVTGRGLGVVVATGMETEIGKIAGLVQIEEMKTPLQKRLARFGRTLALVVLGISAILFVIGVARGVDPTLMLLTAVSLAVAAIPEALPAVVTISLALGAQRMVKKNALIRRLPAVETLGSVTFICSDKTGTLTQNKMKVEEIYVDNQRFYVTGAGYFPEGEFITESKEPVSVGDPPSLSLFLKGASLCNDSILSITENEPAIIGDPTEGALVVMAAKGGVDRDRTKTEFPRIGEIPFDSERKKMTTIHKADDSFISFTKGAYEILLPSIGRFLTGSREEDMTDEKIEEINAVSERMASDGLRTLAICCRYHDKMPELEADDLETDLIFLGLVGIMDPPREEAKRAVELSKHAGIHPVMITGDHPATAKVIAEKLGIMSENTLEMNGPELAEIDIEELEARVERTSVYARVSPEHKVKIVKALQDRGQIVAMTGDGVNDAPALKRADIGIAMGITGTDVSKESSDMILLDDNFSTIVAAAGEGRRIYDNIRHFIKYTMTSNSAEILVMFLAPFLGLPLPFLPVHILWINLVTDGLPGLALAVEPAEKDVMSRPPRHPKESVFAHGLWQHIIWVGLLMAGVSLLSQALYIDMEKAVWTTVIFNVLALSQMGHVLAVRSDSQSLFKLGLFSNTSLLLSVLLTLSLQIAITYMRPLQSVFRTTALSSEDLLFVLSLSTVVFFAVEIEKLVRRRLF